MIISTGIDIIEVERVQKELERDHGLKEKLFTPVEIAYCTSKHFPFQHFAVRYAAKEAFFKALGTGWRHGMQFSEICISNRENGQPELSLSGKVKEFANDLGISKIHVSLSHLKNIATAIVIIEKQ